MIHDERISNKLLVLFTLDKMEMPVKEELLLSICSIDNQWIPYFYCKQVITDLNEAGFITKIDDSNNDPMFTLTEDGRTCLLHFYNDIPKSIRDTVTEFARNSRIDYKRKQEFYSNYQKNADGSYTVNMGILEITKPIMEIKIVVPTNSKAISINSNWNKKAPEVYKNIFDIMVE